MGVSMEITQEHRSRIEEIMSEVQCPKNFACYRSGFTDVGEIKGIGTAGFLKCLEPNSQDCQFSLSFTTPCSCLCPVRIYIATEFHK